MNKERGITIYLALLTMSTALAIALFVASVHLSELKSSQEVSNSLKAVYVADSAVEFTLYQTRRVVTSTLPLDQIQIGRVYLFSKDTSITPQISLSGSQYSLNSCASSILNTGTSPRNCSVNIIPDVSSAANVNGCPTSAPAAGCTQIIGKGTYGSINRAIEIVYENK